MKKLLLLVPLSLALTGCAIDGFLAPPTTGATAATPAAGMNIPAFIGRIEAARGTALGVAEKAAVGGAVQQTRGLIDAGQQRFLGAVAQVSGLDTGTLGILFPPAAQPISQSEAVGKLEGRLGRQLGGTEAQAIKAATLLRNNSLSSLKSGLAGKVGGMVGLPGEFVESLFPLVGL
jgi:hypothetical protein